MTIRGWIIYNGYLTGNKFRDFAEWIQEAAEKQSIQTTIYQNNELLALLASDSMAIINTKTTDLPDFAVFADKDIYLAKQLELLGVRVFNKADTIAASDDKITSYQLLAYNQFPVPKTVVAPKAFYHSDNSATDDYYGAAQTLGFPMIIKEAFGSFGEQVHLIKTMAEMTEKIRQLHGRPFMLQEFIASSYGKDMRLHVVGGRVVAAMTRQAPNDFRSNITAGGTMQSYHPTREEKNLAIGAANVVGADFAGIDLLIGPDKTPIICEINSNAHIRNMFDCTGINIADYMMAYIKKKIT